MLSSPLTDSGLGGKIAAATSSHFFNSRTSVQISSFLRRTENSLRAVDLYSVRSRCIVPGGKRPYVRAVSIGSIVDLGITDANNMGAAMAPAAATTIKKYFDDTGFKPDDFDYIVTGDLGLVGDKLFK